MTRSLPACALLLALSLPAAADKITLKGGGGYEGSLVRESETEITLSVLVGGKPVEMTVNRDLIETYEKTPTQLEQYAAKQAQVDRKNPDALVDLAAWCRDQRLMEQAAKHLIEALALKPDHAKAVPMIVAMGYVRAGNTWVSEAEQKRAQGLEKWGNQWLPKEQVAKLRAEQEAKWKADREEAKRQSDLDIATRGMARTEREVKALQDQIKATAADITACEDKIKELEKARSDVEKQLADATQRRDSARSDMQNTQNGDWNNNVNDASHRYSEAKKDVRAAGQDLNVVASERNRVEQMRRTHVQEKEALEKKLAAKQAETERYAAQKAAAEGTKATPAEPAKTSPKDPPKDPTKPPATK